MAGREITIKFLRGGKYQTEPLRGIKGKEILVKEGEVYTGPYEFGYKMVEAGAAEEVIQEKADPVNGKGLSDSELFLQSIVDNADDDKGAREALGDWAKKEHDIDIDKRNGIPKIIESIIKDIKDEQDSE